MTFEIAETEPLERDRAIAGLDDVVRRQAASALRFAFMAGSARGVAEQYVASRLAVFARSGLDDLRRVVEKSVALGGSPRADVALELRDGPFEELIAEAIEEQQALVEALRCLIPLTGTTGEGEALEHLLEHVIMRSQEQVDFLVRAVAR